MYRLSYETQGVYIFYHVTLFDGLLPLRNRLVNPAGASATIDRSFMQKWIHEKGAK